MKKVLDTRLKRAKQRKEARLFEKRESKIRKEIEYFKKHSEFRHKTLLDNIKRYEMYTEQQRKEIEVVSQLKLVIINFLLIQIFSTKKETQKIL